MRFKAYTTIGVLAASLSVTACAKIPTQWNQAQQQIQQITKPASDKKMAVDKTEFGIVKVNPADYTVSFTPTNKVLLKEGTAYGWRIQLKDYQGQVTWREVYRLPKAAKTWKNNEKAQFSTSADKIEGVTSRTVYTGNGVIGNTWTVLPGDPTGKHTIEVSIDNRPVGKFEFDVVAAK